jgi:hypothetical protein
MDEWMSWAGCVNSRASPKQCKLARLWTYGVRLKAHLHAALVHEPVQEAVK